MNRFTASLIAGLFTLGLSCASTAVDAQEIDKGASNFPKLNAERDWPWWRGPSRNGDASTAGAVPTQLAPNSATWKVPVPGRGHSSPTVVGERVYLATADENAQVHSIVAFDRAKGQQLWKTDISKGGFPKSNHSKNTEATSTLACDGERLFSTFFHHEMVQASAVSLDGKILWQVKAGAFNPKKYEYGYAPSPVLYRNSVIVTGEYDGDGFITGLDRTNGKTLWRISRRDIFSFSTPVIAHIAGRDQMLISGGEKISSYDPATGKPLWTATGCAAATCGTIVWGGDIVFASGGYPKAETVAVKADGSGKVLWKNSVKCYEQSMIVVGEYVYGLADNGILFCWSAKDGTEMWKQRLRGPVSASPIFAGGNLYQADEMGKLYVWKPNPQKFEPVAENQIGADSFPSPAVSAGQIFLRVGETQNGRRQEFLYCFGTQR